MTARKDGRLGANGLHEHVVTAAILNARVAGSIPASATKSAGTAKSSDPRASDKARMVVLRTGEDRLLLSVTLGAYSIGDWCDDRVPLVISPTWFRRGFESCHALRRSQGQVRTLGAS